MNEVVKYSNSKQTNSVSSKSKGTTATAASLRKKNQDVKITELREKYADELNKAKMAEEEATQNEEYEGVGFRFSTLFVV